MTWIKIGQEEGWIEFKWFPPRCVNYPTVEWDDITLPGNTSGRICLHYDVIIKYIQHQQHD